MNEDYYMDLRLLIQWLLQVCVVSNNQKKKELSAVELSIWIKRTDPTHHESLSE